MQFADTERKTKAGNRLVTGGKFPIFLSSNNKALLIMTEKGWRRIPIRSVAQWNKQFHRISVRTHPTVGERVDYKELKKIFNRLVKLLTGNWVKALATYRLAGRLSKRLMLKKYDFRLIAVLIATEFPYAEQDVKRCPAVLAARIRAMLGGVTIDPKTVNWLGSLQILTKPFKKSPLVNWTPKTYNDLRIAQALDEYERCKFWAPPQHIEEVRRRLLQLACIRNEIKRVPRDLFMYISDGVRLVPCFEEWGLPVPTFNPANVREWHDTIMATYRTESRKRADDNYTRRLAMPCPGEGFIADLEAERVKTGWELVDAGDQLHHCVGSYVGALDYVHYRRGSVVCQVSIRTKRVTQCFDAYNKKTDASRKFEAEITDHLKVM